MRTFYDLAVGGDTATLMTLDGFKQFSILGKRDALYANGLKKIVSKKPSGWLNTDAQISQACKWHQYIVKNSYITIRKRSPESPAWCALLSGPTNFTSQNEIEQLRPAGDLRNMIATSKET